MQKVFVDELRNLLEQAKGASYAEIRYHSRLLNEIRISNGELDRIRSVVNDGVGIRVLVDGCWGFSSTSERTKESLLDTMRAALSSASLLSKVKQRKVEKLADAKLAVGIFKPPINGKLEDYTKNILSMD